MERQILLSGPANLGVETIGRAVQSLYPLEGRSNSLHGFVLLVNESSKPIKTCTVGECSAI